ncbi:MICOS complex subunit MIC60 isoform X2 [Eutrema salsugineum]|uniref:MICOS complex subunit MIC60 isoform X2 n=1 Tax=Eutrema salsugineum TaxID=72664 RepID=UPI000CED549C|nr:MICOS complex subunit MIC60 isoform X2 [Eutrema salsugineum]
MLRKSVLELSSRLSIKRFPRNLGAQRFHLSSSRKASTSGKNGANPVGKPNGDPPKASPPPPPPVGKPDGSKGSSSKVVIGGVAVVGAFLVAYQTGYLDQYLGKEKQTISEPVTENLEEADHLNVAPGVEDSTGISSSMDSKAETQPEVPHSEASAGVQSDILVQPESDVTPDRYTYVSSNQEETPQEIATDRTEKSSPISSDDNSASEDSSKSDTSTEAENVRLEAVPQPGDSTVVSAQPTTVDRESDMESASPKDPATEKAPQDDIEREVEMPGSLLKEYNLEGSSTESTRSLSTGEQLTKETEALPNSIEGLKDGYMTEDRKLVLDFLDAIHEAEKRQAHSDDQFYAEKIRAMKEKYENELRDLRARELMRIEEAAILDKELKREKTKAAAAIKAIQERMEDKLKTEIEQKETEAQLALSKAEEMAKAELISAIVKEKAAQTEKMAEADLNIKALCMAFYARSEEARQSHSVHKLALGALALDDTLSKGLPVQREIDMLQTYLEGIHKNSMLDLVLSSLPEEARSNGTDTILQLNQKFNTLKGTLRHFSLIPPGGGGILAHSLAHVASWLKFKEVDQANGGIESVIRKVDDYLAEGKIAEAAAALEEGVKGSKAEEIVGDWVTRARNRAITEQALTLLQSYATCASLT